MGGGSPRYDQRPYFRTFNFLDSKWLMAITDGGGGRRFLKTWLKEWFPTWKGLCFFLLIYVFFKTYLYWVANLYKTNSESSKVLLHYLRYHCKYWSYTFLYSYSWKATISLWSMKCISYFLSFYFEEPNTTVLHLINLQGSQTFSIFIKTSPLQRKQAAAGFFST